MSVWKEAIRKVRYKRRHARGQRKKRPREKPRRFINTVRVTVTLAPGLDVTGAYSEVLQRGISSR